MRLIENSMSKKILNKLNESANTKQSIKESSLNSDFRLFMNTWENYNRNGADAEAVNGGWMDIEQAKEFLEAHRGEEPFINDTDNVPEDLKIDEYSNPLQVIEQLEYIENVDDKDAFIAILESEGNFETVKEIYEDGEYIFFPGVEDDEELGRAYVDMVGFEGVTNAENYLDREQIKEDIIQYLEDSDENLEEFSDDVIEAMVDEDIAAAEGNSDYIEKYFDYEALGRDLGFDGYYFASTGAIQTQ